MAKGAICFFAFSLFLFGCTAKVVYPPPLTPSQTLPLPEFKTSETSLEKEKIELIPKEEPREEVKEEAKEAIKKEVKDDRPREEKIVLKSETPAEPLLLPDIAIADLFFNSNKEWVVVLENRGEGSIPLAEGTLKLSLDGELKESYLLINLSDQTFLFQKCRVRDYRWKKFTSSLD